MDKIIELTKELRSELENTSEFQEYLRLKKILEENDSLRELRENIARLGHENKIEEKKNLQTIYDNNPLVVNFEIAKEEVKNILQTVKDILSE